MLRRAPARAGSRGRQALLLTRASASAALSVSSCLRLASSSSACASMSAWAASARWTIRPPATKSPLCDSSSMTTRPGVFHRGTALRRALGAARPTRRRGPARSGYEARARRSRRRGGRGLPPRPNRPAMRRRLRRGHCRPSSARRGLPGRRHRTRRAHRRTRFHAISVTAQTAASLPRPRIPALIAAFHASYPGNSDRNRPMPDDACQPGDAGRVPASESAVQRPVWSKPDSRSNRPDRLSAPRGRPQESHQG